MSSTFYRDKATILALLLRSILKGEKVSHQIYSTHLNWTQIAVYRKRLTDLKLLDREQVTKKGLDYLKAYEEIEPFLQEMNPHVS